MSEQTVSRNPGPGPWARWGLVALLILIVLAIIAGAYFATHPHAFGASPTKTPTPTATPKPRATPTATVSSAAGGATPTPTLGKKATATATPTAAGGTPTATPNSAGSTPTPGSASGLRTGKIAHPKSQIDQYQSGANAGKSQYTYYTNSYKVVQTNLSQYGFTGSFTIVQPASAAPTSTPYSNDIGLPQVRYIVQYNGKKYGVFLDQPVQKGPKGIWVIIAIWPCAGTTYCT